MGIPDPKLLGQHDGLAADVGAGNRRTEKGGESQFFAPRQGQIARTACELGGVFCLGVAKVHPVIAPVDHSVADSFERDFDSASYRAPDTKSGRGYVGLGAVMGNAGIDPLPHGFGPQANVSGWTRPGAFEHEKQCDY